MTNERMGQWRRKVEEWYREERGDKEARARVWAARIRDGFIGSPAAECATPQLGTHDDQVDVVRWGIWKLSTRAQRGKQEMTDEEMTNERVGQWCRMVMEEAERIMMPGTAEEEGVEITEKMIDDKLDLEALEAAFRLMPPSPALSREQCLESAIRIALEIAPLWRFPAVGRELTERLYQCFVLLVGEPPRMGGV